jgi:hypothetical protein
MLDPQQAAKRMAATFHELTVARGVMDASTNPLETLRAAQRRVTVLARIFLPLHDNAEFKTAYTREMAALRRAALGNKNAKRRARPLSKPTF